jgi:hypothetical protein
MFAFHNRVFVWQHIFRKKNIIFPRHHTDISGTEVSENVTLSATKAVKVGLLHASNDVK